jgi:hypothetical protein
MSTVVSAARHVTKVSSTIVNIAFTQIAENARLR